VSIRLKVTWWPFEDTDILPSDSLKREPRPLSLTEGWIDFLFKYLGQEWAAAHFSAIKKKVTSIIRRSPFKN